MESFDFIAVLLRKQQIGQKCTQNGEVLFEDWMQYQGSCGYMSILKRLFTNCV